MQKAELASAIAEVQSRLSAARARFEDIKAEAQRVNAAGVQCEKDTLGIEGELKALLALEQGASD